MKIKTLFHVIVLGLVASTLSVQAHLAPCEDFVTSGGFIFGTPSGSRANFGAHAGIKNGQLWGKLNYKDHGTGMHVKSTAILEYEAVDENTRRVVYRVKIGLTSGFAEVLLTDNGEPGRNDIFSIELSTGYAASGDLGGSQNGGGNIQLHKGDCD